MLDAGYTQMEKPGAPFRIFSLMAGFLNLGSVNNLGGTILGCGGGGAVLCPAGVFGSTPGFHPQDASSGLLSSCGQQKCL